MTLDRLSDTFDFLTDDEAKRIIDISNNKISTELNAHTVDVLWKVDSWDTTTLKPFHGVDRTTRQGATSLQVEPGSKFVWSWVFDNKELLWIDDVKARRREDSVLNMANGQVINQYFEIFEETDAILAVPLVFRDMIRGILSIELPRTGSFSADVLKQIRWLVPPLTSLIWKADAYALSRQQHSNAIREFGEAAAEQKLFFTPYRTGFIARPFEEQFNDLDGNFVYVDARHTITLLPTYARTGYRD